jgi:hypothetical protein
VHGEDDMVEAGWRLEQAGESGGDDGRGVAEHPAASGAQDKPAVLMGGGYLQDARGPSERHGGHAARRAGLAGGDGTQVGCRRGQERHRVGTGEQFPVVVAEDSLSLAIAAIVDPRPLSGVLIDIVRIGNDTDTNAAIAGGLLGARDGASVIPQRWHAPLQFGPEFY